MLFHSNFFNCVDENNPIFFDSAYVAPQFTDYTDRTLEAYNVTETGGIHLKQNAIHLQGCQHIRRVDQSLERLQQKYDI